MFGLGSANYSVAPNGTGMPRTETLHVAGETLTITQATGSCSYSVSPPSVSAPVDGIQRQHLRDYREFLRAGLPRARRAGSRSPAARAMRNRSVAYTVAPNRTGSQRVGTMTMAGQTDITQAPPVAPTASRRTSARSFDRPPRQHVRRHRHELFMDDREHAAWITVTSGASMFGLGSANYTVASNGTATPRTGTLTVAWPGP